MVDGAPKIVGLAIDLHEDLIEVPAPLGDLAKLLGPPLLDLPRHQRAEPVPPVSNRLMADVDAALVEQILHVPKRQWEPDVYHYRQADDLRRSLEIAKRAGHPSRITACRLTDRFR